MKTVLNRFGFKDEDEKDEKLVKFEFKKINKNRKINKLRAIL